MAASSRPQLSTTGVQNFYWGLKLSTMLFPDIVWFFYFFLFFAKTTWLWFVFGAHREQGVIKETIQFMAAQGVIACAPGGPSPNSVTPRRRSNIYHHVLSKGGKGWDFSTWQAGYAFWLCGAFWWPTFIVFFLCFFFFLTSCLHSLYTAGGEKKKRNWVLKKKKLFLSCEFTFMSRFCTWLL